MNAHRSELIQIQVDGEPSLVPPGISVSAALATGACTRRSVSEQPRQAFCGMGVCQECRVSIEGLPQQTGCQRSVVAGMRIRTDHLADPCANFAPPAELLHTQVLVIGAGPGGLAAAQAAAQAGAKVLLIDAVSLPGGQIWRAQRAQLAAQVSPQVARLEQLGVQQRFGLRVTAVLPEQQLLAEQHDGAAVRIGYQRLILACGARELVLPFPGWTLPGVFGAGGLQLLVKGGWPIRGQRVVVAGSGPLLLAAAASLRRAGAHIVALVEAVSHARLRGFGLSLLRHPQRLWQAARLRAALGFTACLYGKRVSAALGAERLEAVQLDDGSGLACDALAIGDGLLPNLELPLALGCATELKGGQAVVQVDARMVSSQPHILAIGELTGIGGARRAQAQGWIAGAAAADRTAPPRWHRVLRQETAFAHSLATCFPLPAAGQPEPDPNTIICRCEDVPWSALREQADWRSAKLATRVGMGACQGRGCGPILQRLKHWPVPMQQHAAPQACSFTPMRCHSLLALAETPTPAATDAAAFCTANDGAHD